MNKKAILNELIEIRKSRGFSQDFVANQLGVTQKTYSNFENSVSKISIERLYAVAKILRVDLNELLMKGDVNYEFESQASQLAEIEALRKMVQLQSDIIMNLRGLLNKNKSNSTDK